MSKRLEESKRRSTKVPKWLQKAAATLVFGTFASFLLHTLGAGSYYTDLANSTSLTLLKKILTVFDDSWLGLALAVFFPLGIVWAAQDYIIKIIKDAGYSLGFAKITASLLYIIFPLVMTAVTAQTSTKPSEETARIDLQQECHWVNYEECISSVFIANPSSITATDIRLVLYIVEIHPDWLNLVDSINFIQVGFVPPSIAASITQSKTPTVDGRSLAGYNSYIIEISSLSPNSKIQIFIKPDLTQLTNSSRVIAGYYSREEVTIKLEGVNNNQDELEAIATNLWHQYLTDNFTVVKMNVSASCGNCNSNASVSMRYLANESPKLTGVHFLDDVTAIVFNNYVRYSWPTIRDPLAPPPVLEFLRGALIFSIKGSAVGSPYLFREAN